MPQGPIGDLAIPLQGVKSALNVTAATLVKPLAGRVMTLVSIVAGSSGSIVVNDVATVAGAATANVAYTSAVTPAVGTVIVLNWPMTNGIVVTPTTGGTVAVYYN